MKKELSTGGIVIGKTGNGVMVLLIKDMKGVWTFPKGLIEDMEEPRQAAIREVREETGIAGLQALKELEEVHYIYKRHGLVSKTVKYFLFITEDGKTPVAQKEEGIKEAVWKDIREAYTLVGYPDTNAALLAQAEDWLKEHPDIPV